MFARHKVLHRGEVLAAVAATDRATAEAAAQCIRVTYEPLPAVLDVLEALKPEAPLLHENLATYAGVNPAQVHGNVCAQSVVAWGDVEAGFRQADHIFEHTFTTSTVHQSYLEPMATVAQYEPGGKLTIWTSTQGTYVVRSRVAVTAGAAHAQSAGDCAARGRGLWREITDGPGTVLRACWPSVLVVPSKWSCPAKKSFFWASHVRQGCSI